MIGIAAYNVASFVFEYDFYDARDLFGNEVAALKQLTEDIVNNPADVVAFLRAFGMPEADRIAEYIESI